MGKDNNNDRARRIEKLSEDALEIAENSFGHAKKLSKDGDAKGIGAWMYAAEKAIGEIVRLSTIAHVAPTSSDYEHIITYEYDLPETTAN